jgi:DNA-binding GntR family transcriptional regulator
MARDATTVKKKKGRVQLFERHGSSLTDKAYGALEELIVTGELPPGSSWSEGSLAEMISFGRTPTREAVQRLVYQRLVRVAPRQGIHISEIDYQGELKVIQARREIERLIFSQAALLATPSQREQLRELGREFEAIKRTSDMRSYMRAHFRFSQAISVACNNPFASEFWSTLQTLARRFLFFHQNRYNDLAEICDLHVNQVVAVAEGDVDASVSWSTKKNDYAERFTKQIVMDLILSSDVEVRVTKVG